MEGKWVAIAAWRKRIYIAMVAAQPVFAAIAALLIQGYQMDPVLVGLWLGVVDGFAAMLGFGLAAVNTDAKKPADQVGSKK